MSIYNLKILRKTVRKGLRNMYIVLINDTPTRYQKASILNFSHLVKLRSIYTGSGYGTGIKLYNYKKTREII